MLTKVLCKKCINELSVFTWEITGKDERRWKRGMVACPEEASGTTSEAGTKEPPPLWCPYRIEHLMKHEERQCRRRK